MEYSSPDVRSTAHPVDIPFWIPVPTLFGILIDFYFLVGDESPLMGCLMLGEAGAKHPLHHQKDG